MGHHGKCSDLWIKFQLATNNAVKAAGSDDADKVIAQMKKTNKTLKTSIVIYPATKAPKAAVGAKWVGVSYRIDGFKAKP